MAPEVYLACPRCDYAYNVHRRVFEMGSEFTMFCPMCTAEFPRREARVVSANFELPEQPARGR